MRKAKTIDLKNKTAPAEQNYAKVATRLIEFRTDNPRASIKTKPTMLDTGEVMFECYILKDKADQNSADATAHALGNIAAQKGFEKLESIAIGRALALMGYIASGEIASSEEMEEYENHRAEVAALKKADDIAAMKFAKNLGELKELFTKSDMTDPEVIAAKDEMKNKLQQEAEKEIDIASMDFGPKATSDEPPAEQPNTAKKPTVKKPESK